jgi:hypothetical protein
VILLSPASRARAVTSAAEVLYLRAILGFLQVEKFSETGAPAKAFN